jgi:membrane associated rhomboid family serine protease
MGIYGQEEYRIGLGGGLTPAVKYLLIANVACFFLQHLFQHLGITFLDKSVVMWFALVPDWVIHKFAVWQLVTYAFLHGDVWHILFNMLMLWVFGVELERFWGTKEFTRYYFICAIGAGLVHLLVSVFITEKETVSVIGASGAVFGLLTAFGVLFPNRIITFLVFLIFPVNIKAKYLVMISGLIVLFSSLFSTGGNIAHFAHLGGMLVGFLYLKNTKMGWRWGYDDYRSSKTQKPSLGRFGKWVRKRAEMRRQMQIVHRRQQEIQLRERVDAILDKINEVGYENLSDEEKQILKKASQYLSQKNLHSEGLS